MQFSRFLLAALPLLHFAFAQKISLKVNLGGGPVGDFLGEEQVLDMTGFSKNVARVPIQNTDQPELFQSQRFARSSDMTLRIPVPDGVYSVTLLFAETFRPACVPGARVFDISLGTPVSGVTKVVDKFDVFQAAGCTAAHGKRFDNVLSKEGIVVHLSQIAQHPSLAGLIVEGFPQPKGTGEEYKAIARAEGDPMVGGTGMSGGDAQAGAAQAAPLSTDTTHGSNMQGLAAPSGSGGATEYQNSVSSMGAAAVNAPMSQRYQAGPPSGDAQQTMGVGQMPIPGSQPPYRNRRRLLSMTDGGEEVIAEYRDIPQPLREKKTTRVYSRGLKGLSMNTEELDTNRDPDIDFSNQGP